MQTKIEYVRASTLTPAERAEGRAEGTLRFWRRDGNGETWYQREAETRPTIRGVPREGADDDN